MAQTKDYYENLDQYRDIPITRILGIPNTGRRITMRCPIHSERTGSFNLYPDNSYFCFGCGIHGSNAIDFTKALGYSFAESLQELKPYL